jgi:hypothetical protein
MGLGGGGQVRGREPWRGWQHAALGLSLALFGCGGGANGVNPGASGGAAPTPDPLQSASLLVNDITPLAPPSLVVPMDDNEALGPFSSWADAQRDYGAKGDGVTDDTAALQKALDDLGPKKPGLYLPAGRYKITRSLLLKGSPAGGFWLGGVNLMGDTPETTQIIWAGPAGDPMLVQDGGFNTRYSRITWDGRGTAGYGVAHWWNAKGGLQPDGSPEHTDEIFQDMGIGIMAGRLGAAYGELNSEGQVRRVRFIRMSKAGVNTGSWNALDWWVWDSRFTDCARAVSNYFTIGDVLNPGPGAGVVHVYRSLFERSTFADMHIANTGFFSMHQNVSIGSRRFFEGGGMGSNNASIVIQGNRIVDTTDPAAIVNGNLGPLVLIDNQIRSAAANRSAAVVLNDWEPGRDVVSVGNRYTVAKPIQVVDSTDRVRSIDDAVVDASSISVTLPTMPATPARSRRKVFEVAPGTGDIAIQAVIDAAVASGEDNPVVHLPASVYTVKRTIKVPAGVRVQIVGDGLETQLNWAGVVQGTVFEFQGPSRVTVRDMHVLALDPSAYAIRLPQADQVGGRIMVMGSNPGTLQATGLAQTRIALQANSGLGGMSLSNVGSLASIGAGGIGPVQVKDGSRALLADTWFEGAATLLYDIRGGEFTYLNGHMAPATHPGTTDFSQAAVTIDQLQGKASFIAFSVNTTNIPSGIALRVRNATANTQAMFMAISSGPKAYVDRQGTDGQVGFVMNKGANALLRSTPIADQGRSDDAFVRTMMAQARGLVWQTAPQVQAAGASDVRVYRFHAPQTLGVTFSNN